MRISKKTFNTVRDISMFVEYLKILTPTATDNEIHWTESPPEMWNKEEKHLWDTLSEMEEKIKTRIIQIII